MSELEQLAMFQQRILHQRNLLFPQRKSISVKIREQEQDKMTLQWSQLLRKITTEARSLVEKFEAKIIENVNTVKSLAVTKSSLINTEDHGKEQDKGLV